MALDVNERLSCMRSAYQIYTSIRPARFTERFVVLLYFLEMFLLEITDERRRCCRDDVGVACNSECSSDVPVLALRFSYYNLSQQMHANYVRVNIIIIIIIIIITKISRNKSSRYGNHAVKPTSTN
jgi:hypothetical protein